MAHGLDYAGGSFLLGDKSSGPGAERAFGIKQFILHRNDQNQDFGELGAHVLDKFQAIGFLQSQVHNRQVWFGLANHLERFQAVGGLAANAQARLALQNLRQTLPSQRMVIHQQDAHKRPDATGSVQFTSAHRLRPVSFVPAAPGFRPDAARERWQRVGAESGGPGSIVGGGALISPASFRLRLGTVQATIVPPEKRRISKWPSSRRARYCMICRPIPAPAGSEYGSARPSLMTSNRRRSSSAVRRMWIRRGSACLTALWTAS